MPNSVKRKSRIGSRIGTNLQIETLEHRRLLTGSNSQLELPHNLYFADLDGDQQMEFVQHADTQIFGYETNFEKTGILHKYMRDPIERLVVGDFGGTGKDQIAVVSENGAIHAYGTSPAADELWWWFSQGNFIDSNEDSIVGDYDGDGKDDILTYNRSTGDMQMYSSGSPFFAPMPNFSLGNLTSEQTAGLQIRAGDVNADGRDDIITVNQFGQVKQFSSVDDGGTNTFWWAWTSAGGVVRDSDQVQLAKIDNNESLDLVLRDLDTGETRFHEVSFGGGVPPLLNFATGQIATDQFSPIYFAQLKANLGEPGGTLRDDSITFFQDDFVYRRVDARWDSSASNYTYWWHHTQTTPLNDSGWADYENHEWLILKCKVEGVSDEPRDDEFYRRLYGREGHDGVVEYWRDISYGAWDLSNNEVDDTWYQMDETAAELSDLDSRWERISACIDASGRNTSGYTGVIAILNANGIDAGFHGQVLASPNDLNVTFSVHEMAHKYGWGHSWDDTDHRNVWWASPGEYFDHWDIMSAMAVHGFPNSQGVTAGPEMNAPLKLQEDFIPAHRIQHISNVGEYKLAAINRPEANAPLMLRLGTDDTDYYALEFRQNDGWDQGLREVTGYNTVQQTNPNTGELMDVHGRRTGDLRGGVLVHRVVDGRSILITEQGLNQDRQVGEVFTLPNDVTFRIESFDSQANIATVSILGYDVGDSPSTASLIEADTRTPSAIGTSDVDWFTFYAEAGATVTMETELGGLTDTTLELIDSNGSTRLSFNDDIAGASNRASRITHTFADSGQYYAVVRGFLSRTGTYALNLTHADDHGDAALSSTSISMSTTTSGTVEVNGDRDWFAFSVSAGDAVTLQTNIGTLSNTVLDLYDSDGTSLIESNDNGGPGLGSQINWTAPDSGTYFAAVRSFGGTINVNDVGTYSITIVPQLAVGDFDGDGRWSGTDLDLLVAQISGGNNNLEFDLNGDNLTDLDDLDEWLIIAGAQPGSPTGGAPFLRADGNLDGVADVSDFAIWNAHKFTFGSGWTGGDFNADGFTDVSDFNLWNTYKFSSSNPAPALGAPGQSTRLLSWASKLDEEQALESHVDAIFKDLDSVPGPRWTTLA